MSPSTETEANTTMHSDEYSKKTIEHLQRALDDLVSVNSLFTFATFIGISFASSNPQSLELRKECQANNQTRMLLLENQVVSFVCFLFSSLVGTALKMHLSTFLALGTQRLSEFWKFWSKTSTSLMIMGSTLGSILGWVFLTLSMVGVVKVLLGKTACGASDAIQATWSLIGIIILAILIHVLFMAREVYKLTGFHIPFWKHGPQQNNP